MESFTARADGFIKRFLLHSTNFGLIHCREGHTGHIRHDDTGVVTDDVHQVERRMVAEDIVVFKNVLDSRFAVLRSVDRNTDFQRVIGRSRLVAQNQNRLVAER